jgi:MoxR-like ATPase
MEKNLRGIIERINDPGVLRELLGGVLDKLDSLEQRLDALQKPDNNTSKVRAIEDKQTRLEQLRHGITELTERMQRPYVMSAELEAMKNVLETLASAGICNSVILEGEPGTGKTQWAYSEVGQELQEGQDNTMLVHVRVKETMTAQDLLYSIDDVRRLSDAQTKAVLPPEMQAEANQWRTRIVRGEVNPTKDADYMAFKDRMQAVVELGEGAKDLDYINYVNLGPLGEAIYQSSRGKKVWLIIDEIEKGREELMTGMLDEIENLEFTITETGTRVKGDKRNMRIVITTNTEDSDKIPPSFRRRSLYHFVEYPSRADMAQIVELNFPDLRRELTDYALAVFTQYQNHTDIKKKPSIPELLAWLQVIRQEYNEKGKTLPDAVPHKEVLLKYQEDRELEIGLLNVAAQEDIESRRGEVPHYVSRVLKGEKVYHVTSHINDPQTQEEYSPFYAQLVNEGINFATPQFDEEQEYDRYEREYKKTTTLKREFRIVAPGIEYLGDGYYSIPDDQISVLESILDQKLELLQRGQQFVEVNEKNANYTKGKINLDGNAAEAYMLEDGKVIVARPLSPSSESGSNRW